MEIIDNIPVWGAPVDDGALRQIKTCYYIFGQAAMMADHHKGYGVPIGGVIAHETLVSPSGVGYDIGCGNKAVLTDADAADVRANISRIMETSGRPSASAWPGKTRSQSITSSSTTTTMTPGRSSRAPTARLGG